MQRLVEVELFGNSLRGCAPPIRNVRVNQMVEHGGTPCFAVEGMAFTVETPYLLAGDALSITAAGDAVNGVVTLDGATVTYRHDGSETTTGGFTYTVTDGTETATALVTIAVSPVNDPPLLVADAVEVQESDTVSVQVQELLANDSDAERDALSITAVGDAVNGVVTLDGATITYRHDGSETTTGGFTYTVTDGAETATALVTIAVSPVNDPPLLVADAVEVQESDTVSVQVQELLANDSDAERDALSITAVGDAVNGVVTLDGATITYRHDGYRHDGSRQRQAASPTPSPTAQKPPTPRWRSQWCR